MFLQFYLVQKWKASPLNNSSNGLVLLLWHCNRPGREMRSNAALFRFANSQTFLSLFEASVYLDPRGKQHCGEFVRTKRHWMGPGFFCWPSLTLVSQVHLSQSPWGSKSMVEIWADINSAADTSGAKYKLQVLKSGDMFHCAKHRQTKPRFHSSAHPFFALLGLWMHTRHYLLKKKTHKFTSYLQSWGTLWRLSNAVF